MITRKQMTTDSKALYAPYMAQFVTPLTIEYVRRHIGEERILASADPHLNDIELSTWERVCYTEPDGGGSFRYLVPTVPSHVFAELGEWRTRSVAVGIAKAAARQIADR